MVSGTPNWSNLLGYFRRRHALAAGVLQMQARNRPQFRTTDLEQILAIICMVDNLRDVPWDRILPIVQGFRRGLISYDARWAEEEMA